MNKNEKCGKPDKNPPEKYKLSHSEILGRYFVAAKDLTAGEVILRESVYAVGPGAFTENYMCFACLRLLPDVNVSKRLHSCTSCKVAVFCSPACQEKKVHHTRFECDAFGANESLSSLEKLPVIMQILLPLRVWLLQRSDRASWQRVLEMEAHIEQRRDTPIWKNRQVNVIEVLRSFGLVEEEEEAGREPELLQRLCSILDVNSFELRPPGGLEDSPLRGLYPDTAIMAHDCIRNTHITVDDKFRLTVYASLPIKAGQAILVNYTSPLLGSEERRDHLRTGKYFECVCARCSDPKELGSNLSTLVCPRCKSGFVANTNPLRADAYADRESWRCDRCESALSGRLVRTTLALTKSLLTQTKFDTKSGEELLNRMERTYHPNHFFVVTLKQKLLDLYKKECACLNPGATSMKRMVKIAKDVIDVLEIVEPGILLWEIHLPLVLLADHDYTSKKITAERLVERLEEAEGHLKRSLTMLLLEPPDTPEGFLARQALEDCKSLKKTIAQARLLDTSVKMSRKNKSKLTSL